MCEKPLHTRFNRADGFITIYNGIRYLVFGHFGYDKICDKIKYLFSEKSGIANVLIIILQEPELIHIILYLWKTIHNVTILI